MKLPDGAIPYILLEPLITIQHDEMPVYLAEHYDGWSSRHVIDCYVKYAKVLFERFGKKCNTG